MSRNWKDSISEIISESVVVDGDDKADEIFEVTLCGCVSYDLKSTCKDISCVNFAMQIECSSKCGTSCQNNRFRKKKQAKLDVVDMPNKGFGLVLLEDLKANRYNHSHTHFITLGLLTT